MTSPRITRWLIRIAAPEDRLDELLGDLEEVHRRRRETGRAAASFATIADALVIAAILLGGRLSGLPRVLWEVCLSHFASGVKLMWQAPLMTLTATAALALGIGLLTMGGALADAFLFSRLPFEGGDRFVVIRTLQELERRPVTLAPADYGAIASADALTHIGAVSQGQQNAILPSGSVETLDVASITPSSLALLPYPPVRGRALTPADGEPGAEPVLVVRDAFWKQALAGAEDVVGMTLDVGGIAHRVVGVMPNEFEFPSGPSDVWSPMDESFRSGRVALAPNARLVGMLAPDHSIESAQAQLDVLAERISSGRRPGGRVRLEVASATDLGPLAPIIASALMAVVLALLVVVAANVANLVLARSFARSRELAVRAALGASRARLVGQMIGELLPLFGLAAIFGALAARAVVQRFNAIDDLPFWMTFSVGPRALTLAVFGVLVATGLAGAWPALKVTRGNLVGALPTGARASDVSFGRVAGVIVVVQIAVSVVMLHGALVVAGGVTRYSGGTAALPDGVLTAGLLFTDTASADASDSTRASPQEAEEIALRLPGVIAAGLATALPRQSPPTELIEVEALPDEISPPPLPAPSARVSPGFFETLDATVLAGRLLTPDDERAGASPVAVVNTAFVEKFLGGEYPIGRRFRAVGESTPNAWREIVGVVPDLGLSIGDPSLAAGYYIPLDRTRESGPRFVYVAMRVSGDPASYVEPLRRAIYGRDAAVVLNRPVPLEDIAADDRSFFLWFSTALSGIGVLTLVLALTGVYSMMALIVTKRTREIGIRIAMGATARGIVQPIAGRAVRQVAVGALVGGALAVLSLELRGVLVSRLPDGGVWTLPAVLTLLAAAGIAATAVPLRRAIRVQPSDSMRAD